MSRSGPRPVTAEELPLRVPLIHCETLASYLRRTAAANGRGVVELLAAVARDALDPAREDLDPQREEVHLDPGAVESLAALVRRDREQLARALPAAHPDRLTDAPRIEPWPTEFGQGPLPACPLCMEPGAWLAPQGLRWHPCSCGRRWLAGDDGGYLVDTGPLPELSGALQRHRDLVHRLGPTGDALVADAHQVTLWWWVSRQFAPQVWRGREDALGMHRHRRRAAPVVVYPEAVALAERMWRWEERRRRPRASPDSWVDDVAALRPDGALSRREREPLRYWLEQHRAEPAQRARGRTAAERRWNRLPALHEPAAEHGPLRTPSCLMWVYGLPLTETTRICPRCNGRAPSCRWVPYPRCTGRPGT